MSIIVLVEKMATIGSLTIAPIVFWVLRNNQHMRQRDYMELKNFFTHALEKQYRILEKDFLRHKADAQIEGMETRHQDELTDLKINEIILRITNLEKYLAKETTYSPRSAITELTPRNQSSRHNRPND